MFGCNVEEGALFYGQTRRRQAVAFDKDLRRLTLETIQAAREMIRRSDADGELLCQTLRCLLAH